MTQLLLTIIIGIGIATVAVGGALTLFQSARDGVDQQMLWARMEQTAAALRSKIIVLDGLPTLPMAETSTDSYPAVPVWVTANGTDMNAKRFVYCPFALRDTGVEGTSTTVTGPGYSVVTYSSTITGNRAYVVGAIRPTLAGTASAAPAGLLGVMIAFPPKSVYSASVAANWCNNLTVSAAGAISASYSSTSGVVYPITVPQNQIQQAIAKRESVTLYVNTAASGDGTGRNTSNYTTLDAAFAQLAAVRPYRAKIYLAANTGYTLSAVTKLDGGGNDVYNRGNLQDIIYDIEGAGSGTTKITLSTDYDLPVNTYWRKVEVAAAAAQKVYVQPNTKTIIEDAIINNLFVKQGTAWVRGTSALNTSVVVTDVGRLVINGTVTSTVADQSDSGTLSGILIRPGRVDILPSKSWSITSTSNGSSPSAPVVVFGGGILSNSGTMSIVSNGSTQLKAAMNVVPGGIVNMNNATLSMNSGSSTIAGGGGTSQKGAIVLGGEMYMVNSGLLFPGGTSANVAGVMLVDGGKFYMHANSYIGSSGTPAQRPDIGVYDNGGSYVGGSTAGYTSGANGEGGGARSNVYASTLCWSGNGDANNGGTPSARYRHLFIDSDEGDGLYSSPKDTYTSAGTVNKLAYTADLSTGWGSYGSGGATSVVSGTRVDAPDGSNSAITITATRPGTGNYTARRPTANLTLTGQHTASVWVRAHAAGDIGKKITFWTYAGGQRNVTDITLTGTWTRVTMNNSYNFPTVSAESFTIGFLDCCSTSTDTSVSYDIWGAQMESGTSMTDYSDVGAAGTGGVADYRHLRITNNSDWQCTRAGGGGGGGDPNPDDGGGDLAGCPATNTLGTYTTTPNHTPTGFDTTTTISISCPLCAGVSGSAGYSKNGGANTTAVGTFSPGDNFNIQFCFGANGFATATVTIGTATYSCQYTKTGRVAPACTLPTP